MSYFCDTLAENTAPISSCSLSLLILALIGSASASCGSEKSAEKVSVQTNPASIHHNLYIETPTLYSKTRPRILVCFDSASYAGDTVKNYLIDQIRSVFESELRVHFYGWTTCPSTSTPHSGVVIRFADTRPFTQGRGTTGEAYYPSMTLNATYGVWSPSCATSDATKEQCTRWIAAHEFGHLLSAYHEQQRPDVDPNCMNWLKQVTPNDSAQWKTVPSGNGTNVAPSGGAYDSHSMMNYCSDPCWTYNGVNYGAGYLSENGGVMSPGDAAGWQSIFGIHKTKFDQATIIGQAGKTSRFSLKSIGTTSRNTSDLIMIAMANTGSGTVEVHAASAASNYQSWNMHSGSGYSAKNYNPELVEYQMGYFDNDNIADLFLMQQNYASGRLEVHVTKGSSNWNDFAVHTSTVLTASPNYKFILADYNNDSVDDLFAIRTSSSGPYLNILDGASSYTKNLYETYPQFSNSQVASCTWVAGDFDNDGKVDLLCMDSAGANGKTWVYATSGAKGFNDPPFMASQATQEANFVHDNSDYVFVKSSACADGTFNGCSGDVAYIKKDGPSSTEIHTLDMGLYFN